MAESTIKRLLVQASHYSLGGLAGMIAGLITFPLLTRLFTLEDYGAMNLVAATLTMSVALGKLGVQHSILRYQSEIVSGKSPFTLGQLYSTTLFGMGASALVVMLGLSGLVHAAPGLIGAERLRLLFSIASFLILVQVLESSIVNLLRAEQRTAAMVKYTIVKKYLSLGLMLGAVLLIAPSLSWFYGAQVVAELLALLGLARVFFGKDSKTHPTPREFSRPLYLGLLKFGIPMMLGHELAGIVLSVGDRYVIEGMLGPAALGLYGAAYNLCMYVQGLVIASIGAAIMPMYMRTYDEKGAEETSAFVSRSLRTYVLFAAPVIAGLGAVGSELLPSLASEKYAAAASVLPWVIAGMVCEGMNPMLGAGLFIHRRTRTIMAIVIFSAALNLGLNFVLIPHFGITGSAMATLAAYAANASALRWSSRELLPVAMPWGTIARAGAVAVFMYFACFKLYPGHRLLTVAVRVAVGAPAYLVPMILIDDDGRAFVMKVLNRLRRR